MQDDENYFAPDHFPVFFLFEQCGELGGRGGGGEEWLLSTRPVCVCVIVMVMTPKKMKEYPLYIPMDLHQSGAKCGAESQKSQIKGTVSPGWIRPESGLGGQILNSTRIIVLHGPRCIALVFSKPSKCKCTLNPS
jgi:hypothetical protein